MQAREDEFTGIAVECPKAGALVHVDPDRRIVRLRRSKVYWRKIWGHRAVNKLLRVTEQTDRVTWSAVQTAGHTRTLNMKSGEP